MEQKLGHGPRQMLMTAEMRFLRSTEGEPKDIEYE
jgi:hypothetical protein